MSIDNYDVLQEKVSKVNTDEMYATICSNIKKFRLEKYEEFKSRNSQSMLNPYSTENVAALLDYNHNHYKRFESAGDSTKKIPLNKLAKIAIILDKTIDELMK